jgi:hypothetical protein
MKNDIGLPDLPVVVAENWKKMRDISAKPEDNLHLEGAQ